MRDELYEPLGQGPRRQRRGLPLKTVAVWSGRACVALIALGAVALYWRATTPRPEEVAVIPAAAVKIVAPTPVAVASPEAAAVKVFPPPPGEDGVTVAKSGGRSPQIIDVAQALGLQAAPPPEKRLLETSKFGALPRVGADGAKPYETYARPYAETPLTRGAPRIAVFVGGLGLDARTTEAAVASLPGGVSLGLAPYGADLAHVAANARAAGHEIWLQAPMEGIGGDAPGPHTLTVDAGEAANQDSLHWLMSRFPGYVGVENYLGAKFTADAGALSPTLAEIARRGLLYLDDGSSALSKAGDLAPGLDLKAGRADVIVDGGPEAIDAALARAEDLARRRGSAIVVATALPATLDRLAPWAQGLSGKGFALAPVSALVLARPDKAALAK